MAEPVIEVEHAKARATIRLSDGRLAILLAVHPRARTAKVVIAGRHHRVPLDGAVLVPEIDLASRLSGAARRRLGLGDRPEHPEPSSPVDVS